MTSTTKTTDNIYRTTIDDSSYFVYESEEYNEGDSENAISKNTLFIKQTYNDSSYMASAHISIRKSAIRTLNMQNISKVELRLKCKSGAKGNFVVNGTTYSPSNSYVYVDITNNFKVNTQNATVYIDPRTSSGNRQTDIEFYVSGDYRPQIIIYDKILSKNYKAFPVTGDVTMNADIMSEPAVWIFNDILNRGLSYRLNIVHIFIKGTDGGQNKYYGKDIRPCFSERLVQDGCFLFYTDAAGDCYVVADDKVSGMKFTTDTPDWVAEKYLYQNIIAETGSMRWLESGNILKGFNADGYLVLISDETRKLYLVSRSDYNIITNVYDANGTTLKGLYHYEYC